MVEVDSKRGNWRGGRDKNTVKEDIIKSQSEALRSVCKSTAA